MRSLHPRYAMVAALAALLSVTGAAACASTGPPAEPYATVIVDNDSPSTFTVYAIRSGTRIRLGQVYGRQTAEFSIRPDMLSAGRLQLMIDPIGSPQTYPSQSIVVYEGEIVELQVSSFIR